ncbi:type I restriction system adenine methylase [Amycolatopsis mediterranei S699]|uniref:Type I restriction system adenine methylase n=2 Tax=Amycolatopsis mediterranei TaxID=33910 RepID=A0A9R0UE54_AMYMS|nr:N-6 DNA methylase [Amycolatopsis mediterranei]ADJ50633.1 putative type I restriction system adenine methylase [Amycolatopsis mediterranei U32]AEK47639.1 type I restriction system adenine methylase [Amycolatopsis mediterranei S699]AFO82339.1 type I restriction system adenine methylase [Amycolatopsis mediterranei S699]AGT89468.1 type I restriction system adenine methylase [Amycolatopsis mediterranei RB]KDO12373.1 SAM-dependent methyltransferase [Amycolatopsis mediterranei]
MDDDATVSAADIARLAGVGRAAVSNWRRRYPDFPPPVGGTASSPLFGLSAVAGWFRARGKKFELSAGERAWQRLRALGDDLDLAERVSRAGGFFAFQAGISDTFDSELDDPELLTLLSELTHQAGPVEAFELVCRRYFEAHSRRLSATPEPIAELMARLAGPVSTILDPACGFGALALASGAKTVLGQDSDPMTASIAALRLRLRGLEVEVHAVDALREDAFAGRTAEAVLCDPPFNERAWGHDELVGDARWEYGLPPRGEPELAWVQHCLAHVEPGGTVVILMPGAAAGRRSGKRIRGNLLRAGAVRAVVTLTPTGPDLWLLRRPAPGERAPSTVLLGEAGDDLSTVEESWREFGEHPESGVRIIDLLDDDVDLTPARRRTRDEDPGLAFQAVRTRFAELAPELPPLEAAAAEPAFTTIGELVKAGFVEVKYAPVRADAEHPPAEAGDVVASVTGIAYVHSGPPRPVGAGLTVYRVDAERLDAEFLAGCLRAADLPAASASTRIDSRRVRIPRVSLAVQREYGEVFRRLAEFDAVLRETAETGRELVRLGFAGLVGGRLRPGH